VFTERLHSNGRRTDSIESQLRDSYHCCGVTSLRLRGSLFTEPHKKLLTPIVALRVFGREVFHGQLPSNAVSIHVTIRSLLPTKALIAIKIRL
jgi:hypothetical protein